MLKKISDMCYMCRTSHATFLLRKHRYGSYNYGRVWDLIAIIGIGNEHVIAEFATKDDGTGEMCRDCEGNKIWTIDDMLKAANLMIQFFEK